MAPAIAQTKRPQYGRVYFTSTTGPDAGNMPLLANVPGATPNGAQWG